MSNNLDPYPEFDSDLDPRFEMLIVVLYMKGNLDSFPDLDLDLDPRFEMSILVFLNEQQSRPMSRLRFRS